MTYHILKVRGGSEHVVQDRLERRKVESIVPSEEEIQVRKGRKLAVRRPLISRYVFSRGELGKAKATPGVYGVLRRSDKEPVVISEAAVKALSAPIKPQPMARFKRGDRVRVLDGPVQGHSGTITALRKGRVTVDVSIFGRPTPVELDCDQVELAR